jgi:hypothetical protein
MCLSMTNIKKLTCWIQCTQGTQTASYDDSLLIIKKTETLMPAGQYSFAHSLNLLRMKSLSSLHSLKLVKNSISGSFVNVYIINKV